MKFSVFGGIPAFPATVTVKVVSFFRKYTQLTKEKFVIPPKIENFIDFDNQFFLVCARANGKQKSLKLI